MKYTLEIIPGTADFVSQELVTKYPEVRIEDVKKDSLIFESHFEDVDQFRDLYSPLRIQKENGLVRNLFRREWKVTTAPAGINPSLAYIMCMIADIQTDDVVYDPFCGAGTIPLTAAIYFHPYKVFASDKDGKAIDMTIENIKAADFPKNIFVAFKSSIEQVYMAKNSITKIITNLPFGIRVGKHNNNEKIYNVLANKAAQLLTDDGLLVLLTVEKKLIEDIFNNKPFYIKNHFSVEQGGLSPSIFIIAKKKLSA